MVVNLLGCFLIGLIYSLSAKCVSMTDEGRLFLAVGLCGGFTTFSTFSAEALELLRAGRWLYGALYLEGSFFLGLLAGLCSHALFAYSNTLNNSALTAGHRRNELRAKKNLHIVCKKPAHKLFRLCAISPKIMRQNEKEMAPFFTDLRATILSFFARRGGVLSAFADNKCPDAVLLA